LWLVVVGVGQHLTMLVVRVAAVGLELEQL
jgi:hypothetical protein